MPKNPSLERRTRRAGLLFLLPGAVFFAAVFLYPMIQTIQMSFSDVTAKNITRGGWGFVGLDNYVAVFELQAFGMTLRNTVIFLVASIIPQLVLGLLLAIGLKKSTRARNLGRALVLLPWLLPSVAVATTFLFIFNSRGGLVNWILQSSGIIEDPILWFASPGTALLVIIVVNIWIGIPFNFLILQSGLQGLPDDVHEAAAVDGAGWWRELFFITIPMLSESLFAVIMLGVIGTLKVFDFVWIMTGGGPANGTMLPGPLAYQQAFSNFNYGQGSAVIVLTVLLMVVLSLVYVRLTSPRRRPRRAAVPSAVARAGGPSVVAPPGLPAPAVTSAAGEGGER